MAHHICRYCGKTKTYLALSGEFFYYNIIISSTFEEAINLFKRKIKLTIIIFLIAALLTPAVFAEGMYGMMTESGIMTGWNDSYGTDLYVTRAEFTYRLLSAMGLSGVHAETRFVDLDGGIETPYIVMAELMGLANSEGDRFRPYDFITFNSAIKMIIDLADLAPVAESWGGYPFGYLLAASKFDLLNKININNREFVTREDAAALMYNMLNGSLPIKKTYESGLAASYEKSGINRMEQNLNIQKRTGYVEANSLIAVSGSPAPKNRVTIDGVSYGTGGTNAAELLGLKVEYFISTDENANREILFISPYRYDEVILSSADIKSISPNSLEYYSDDALRERRLNISGSKIIRDGDSATFAEALFLTKSTRVRLVSTNDDGNYKLIFIERYATYVVDRVNAETKMIYPKSKDGMNVISTELKNEAVVDLKDKSVLMIYNSAGESENIEGIFEWDVLEVCLTADGRGGIIRIINNARGGAIDSTDADGVYIGGELYKFADDKQLSALLTIGMEVTLYLDIDGKIAGFKRNAPDESFKYAYLAEYQLTGGVDKKILCKIFTQEGELNLQYLSAGIRINDNACKSFSAVNSVLEPNQMIVFRENADREITEIHTASTDKNKPLTRNDGRVGADYVSLQYFDETNILVGGGKRFAVHPEAYIFFADSRNRGEYSEDTRYPQTFELLRREHLKNWVFYNCKIYECDDMLTAKVILMSAPNYIDSGASYVMLVDRVTTVLDALGMPITRISGLTDGADRSFNLRRGLSAGAAQGDIVYFKTNRNGEILQQPSLIYKNGTPIPYANVLSTDGDAFGRVMAIDQKAIVLGNSYEDAVQYPLSPYVYVYEYDKSSKRCVIKALEDIVTADNTAYSDKVYIYFYDNRVRTIIKIND